MKLPDGLLVEHRVERDQFIDIDRLKTKLGRDPFDRLVGEAAKMFLNRMQNHERCASLLWIMRDQLVDLPFKPGWNAEVHRSHSPMTKSSEPRMATASLIMWPGSR